MFAPRKLEYEALGNPGAPIWEDLDFLRMLWTRSGRAAPDVVDARRAALLHAFRNTDVTIEAEYVWRRSRGTAVAHAHRNEWHHIRHHR